MDLFSYCEFNVRKTDGWLEIERSTPFLGAKYQINIKLDHIEYVAWNGPLLSSDYGVSKNLVWYVYIHTQKESSDYWKNGKMIKTIIPFAFNFEDAAADFFDDLNAELK